MKKQSQELTVPEALVQKLEQMSPEKLIKPETAQMLRVEKQRVERAKKEKEEEQKRKQTFTQEAEMKEVFEKLAKLADNLDKKGLHEEANRVDALIKEAANEKMHKYAGTCPKCNNDMVKIACAGCGDTGDSLPGDEKGLFKRAGLLGSAIGFVPIVGDIAQPLVEGIGDSASKALDVLI